MSFDLFQNSYITYNSSKLVTRIKYISVCPLKVICWKCAIIYVEQTTGSKKIKLNK